MSLFRKFFSGRPLTGLLVLAMASLMMLTVSPWLRGNGSATAQENIVTTESLVAPAGIWPVGHPVSNPGTLAGTLATGPTQAGSATVVQLTPGGEPSVGATGFGQASAPAESATVQFTFFKIPTISNPYPGPIRLSELNPIVAALTATGIRQQDIRTSILYPYTCEPNFAEMLVNIATGVSQQRILQIVSIVNQVTCNGNLRVYSVGVAYSLSNCEPLVRQALQAAISDGRMRAQRLASVLGVQLGGMQLAADYSIQYPVGSGCSQSPFQLSPVYTTFDPAAPAQVTVSIGVQLAFAIQ